MCNEKMATAVEYQIIVTRRYAVIHVITLILPIMLFLNKDRLFQMQYYIHMIMECTTYLHIKRYISRMRNNQQEK